MHQGAHDHEALLLPTRHLRHLGARLVGETHSLEQLVRALCRDIERDPEIRRVELQILHHVEAEVGVRALRNHTDGLPHAHRILHHIRARDNGFTRRGKNASGQDSDRGSLPGAIGAEQAEELTGADVEVERVECYDIARGRHCPARRSPPRAVRATWLGLAAAFVNLAQAAHLDRVHFFLFRSTFLLVRSTSLKKSSSAPLKVMGWAKWAVCPAFGITTFFAFGIRWANVSAAAAMKRIS